MLTKKYHLLFLVYLCFSIAACKSQATDSIERNTCDSIPNTYQKLSEKYSDKLILTSINSIYNRLQLKLNDSLFSFPDIYELDSLSTQAIRNQSLNFFKLHDSSSIVSTIDNWCNTYLLLDNFLAKNKQLYFEDIVLKNKHFYIGHYFTSKYQNINSLSVSQEQMLYLDFVNYLSKYSINERVALLNKTASSTNW